MPQVQNRKYFINWFMVWGKKPNPNMFLKPLKESLKKIYQGVQIYVKDIESYMLIRGIIICGTAIYLQRLCSYVCINITGNLDAKFAKKLEQLSIEHACTHIMRISG